MKVVGVAIFTLKDEHPGKACLSQHLFFLVKVVGIGIDEDNAVIVEDVTTPFLSGESRGKYCSLPKTRK